jgi:hypothetical protein
MMSERVPKGAIVELRNVLLTVFKKTDQTIILIK